MFSQTEAEKLAINFLSDEWEIPSSEQEWFTIKYVRKETTWYIVEVGIEGCPDYWILQVYDTGESDPCYTFVSPLSGSEDTDDLNKLPESIAKMVAFERSSQMSQTAKV
jgi:hypothetical protein